MEQEYIKKFLKGGKSVETEFAKLFRSTEHSSPEEDINEHWDIMIKHKVDVKGLKKINRNDADVNENIHWVEVKNVSGRVGWLYSEEVDFFSFETIDYWIIIDKLVLQKFVAEKCKEKEFSKIPELYKLYNRKGRNDVITLVKTIDLIYISETILKKHN